MPHPAGTAADDDEAREAELVNRALRRPNIGTMLGISAAAPEPPTPDAPASAGGPAEPAQAQAARLRVAGVIRPGMMRSMSMKTPAPKAEPPGGEGELATEAELDALLAAMRVTAKPTRAFKRSATNPGDTAHGGVPGLGRPTAPPGIDTLSSAGSADDVGFSGSFPGGGPDDSAAPGAPPLPAAQANAPLGAEPGRLTAAQLAILAARQAGALPRRGVRLPSLGGRSLGGSSAGSVEAGGPGGPPGGPRSSRSGGSPEVGAVFDGDNPELGDSPPSSPQGQGPGGLGPSRKSRSSPSFFLLTRGGGETGKDPLLGGVPDDGAGRRPRGLPGRETSVSMEAPSRRAAGENSRLSSRLSVRSGDGSTTGRVSPLEALRLARHSNPDGTTTTSWDTDGALADAGSGSAVPGLDPPGMHRTASRLSVRSGDGSVASSFEALPRVHSRPGSPHLLSPQAFDPSRGGVVTPLELGGGRAQEGGRAPAGPGAKKPKRPQYVRLALREGKHGAAEFPLTRSEAKPGVVKLATDQVLLVASQRARTAHPNKFGITISAFSVELLDHNRNPTSAVMDVPVTYQDIHHNDVLGSRRFNDSTSLEFALSSKTSDSNLIHLVVEFTTYDDAAGAAAGSHSQAPVGLAFLKPCEPSKHGHYQGLKG